LLEERDLVSVRTLVKTALIPLDGGRAFVLADSVQVGRDPCLNHLGRDRARLDRAANDAIQLPIDGEVLDLVAIRGGPVEPALGGGSDRAVSRRQDAGIAIRFHELLAGWLPGYHPTGSGRQLNQDDVSRVPLQPCGQVWPVTGPGVKEQQVAVWQRPKRGRDVVAPGSDGLARIVDTFGSEVLDRTGALDRRKLGALVFADPEKRRQLEAIMHPLVQQYSRAQFAQLSRDGAPIVVYESALLFESKRHLEMQGSIFVSANEAQRVARVQARDGSREEEVRARMRAQMDEAAKRQLADYVLDNNGDLQALRRQVEDLVPILKSQPSETAS
jgi:dephospho-CoA kinase